MADRRARSACSGQRPGGRRRDFDAQPDLFGEVLADAAADRPRALMWDVPRYLAAKAGEGRPVLAGVVENVIKVRAWSRWGSGCRRSATSATPRG